MGKIAKSLALTTALEPRTLTASGLWGDLCENIHLHYRNIRIDFSELEWAKMRAAVNMIGRALEQAALKHEYKEGNPNFLLQALFDEGVSTDSAYYANRLSIELQKDNTVHVHYRDLRLHLTKGEFKTVANAFSQALKVLDAFEQEENPLAEVKEPTEMTVDVRYIQPFDDGHRPGVWDDDHRKGVEFCKAGLRAGKTPRPILVDTTGQRKDGFKRLMAQVALGAQSVRCIVDPFAQMGGQNNQTMFLEDENPEEVPND